MTSFLHHSNYIIVLQLGQEMNQTAASFKTDSPEPTAARRGGVVKAESKPHTKKVSVMKSMSKKWRKKSKKKRESSDL